MPSIRRFQRPGPKSLDALNATTAQTVRALERIVKRYRMGGR